MEPTIKLINNEEEGDAKGFIGAAIVLLILVLIIGFVAYKLSNPKQDEECDNCIKFVSENDPINRRDLGFILEEFDRKLVGRDMDIINCYDFGGKPSIKYEAVEKSYGWGTIHEIQCIKGEDVFEFETSETSNWVKADNK